MDKIREFITFIGNIEISQIVNFIIAIAVVIIVLLLAPIISYGIVKVFYRRSEKEEIKNFKIYKALKTFFRISGFYIGSKILNLHEFQDVFCDKCFKVVIIWTIARIVAGVFEARQVLVEKLTKNQKNTRNNFFTSVVSKVVEIVLYIIALYLTLKEFDYDIGGLAAGIGLTGAVVALAAQDFIKQIISGLAIFTDKPFEIGDWIDIEEISGTVEDITIKSTRVRTLEDTIVIVPNDLITNLKVINWGKISKRVYKANLKFALETEESIIEKVINRIKFILKYNEDVITKSISVHLSNIENDGINIEIYLETTITNYSDYRLFCNKINLTLLNILESQGVKLAYPGENIYIKENVNLQSEDYKSKKNYYNSNENKKDDNEKQEKDEERKNIKNENKRKVKPTKIIK